MPRTEHLSAEHPDLPSQTARPPRQQPRRRRAPSATARVDAALRAAIPSLADAGIVPGTRLLVGVSGGQDSLCLAHALWRLRAEHGWRLQVVHVDHGVRAEAAAEAAHVVTLAARWDLPAEVARVDVPAYRRHARLNLQAAARYARYQAFARAAIRLDAAGVLVAHTADDVAETLLLHLLRGAGLDGLAAAPLVQRLPRAALGPPLPPAEVLPPGLTVLRPLLDVARSDTAAYCAEQGLQPVGEPPAPYRRDRVRHDLLPVLERYNPRVREALAATARAVLEERDALDRWTDGVWQQIGQGVTAESGVAIPLDIWRGLPPALQKRVLRRAAVALGGPAAAPGRRHLAAALTLAAGQAGRTIALPRGLRLERRPEALWLAPAWPVAPRPPGPWALPVPGTVVLPGVGVLRAEWQAVAPGDAAAASRYEAWLAAEAVAGPLVVRWRQPGDRFQPLGMAQSKRLQDFLVDARVPRARRDWLPLVVVDAGATSIAWVVGERIAHWARLRPDTRRALRLTFEPLRPGSEAPTDTV